MDYLASLIIASRRQERIFAIFKRFDIKDPLYRVEREERRLHTTFCFSFADGILCFWHDHFAAFKSDLYGRILTRKLNRSEPSF